MRTAKFMLALGAILVAHHLGTQLSDAFPRVIDLFAVLVVLNALSGESLPGLGGGLATGLARDALAGTPFGLHGFALTLVGYLSARVAQQLVVRHATGAFAVVAAAVLLEEAALVIVTAALLPASHLPEPLWVLARALATGVVGGVLFAVGPRLGSLLRRRRSSRLRKLKLD